MNNESAAAAIYNEFRGRLEVIERIIQDMKAIAISLELRDVLDRKGIDALIITDDNDDPEYDFERIGILALTPSGNANLISCREADEWLKDISDSVELKELTELPFLTAFDRSNAIKTDNKWYVANEILIFAVEGKKLRPLALNEVCRICLYFAEHSEKRTINGKDRSTLVLM